jgi:hypothetical protein
MKARFLRVAAIAAAAIGLVTLSSCELILEILHGPVSKGDVQLLQDSTDLTGGGTYSFGSTVAGTNGDTRIFTIKNTGTEPVSLNYGDAVTLSNTADFELVSGLTSTSLADGADITFSVLFRPQSVGTLASTITVHTSAGEITFTASGDGASSGALSLWYSDDNGATYAYQVNDGAVVDIGYGAPLTFYFQILNSDLSGELYITTYPTITTQNTPNDFYVNSYPTSPVTAGGGTATFEINYQDTGNSQDDETVEIGSSDGSTGILSFTIRGHAYAP